jgi:hypothetical protein
MNGHLEPAYWFPCKRLEYRKGIPYYQRRDVYRVDEFFIDRSLCYLAWLWYKINNTKIDPATKRYLKLIFLNTTARASKMNRIQGGPWLLNSYWIPRHFVVRNPRLVFLRQAIQFINYKKCSRSYVKGSLNDLLRKKVDFTILCRDARKTLLPANSVDYIITDPPHIADAQFLELSTFFTSWLREDLPFKKEIVVNPRQGKDFGKYVAMLHEVLKEINRILKYDRYLTLILPLDSQELCEEIKRRTLQLKFRQVECITKSGFKFMTFIKRK